MWLPAPLSVWIKVALGIPSEAEKTAKAAFREVQPWACTQSSQRSARRRRRGKWGWLFARPAAAIGLAMPGDLLGDDTLRYDVLGLVLGAVIAVACLGLVVSLAARIPPRWMGASETESLRPHSAARWAPFVASGPLLLFLVGVVLDRFGGTIDAIGAAACVVGGNVAVLALPVFTVAVVIALVGSADRRRTLLPLATALLTNVGSLAVMWVLTVASRR